MIVRVILSYLTNLINDGTNLAAARHLSFLFPPPFESRLHDIRHGRWRGGKCNISHLHDGGW